MIASVKSSCFNQPLRAYPFRNPIETLQAPNNPTTKLYPDLETTVPTKRKDPCESVFIRVPFKRDHPRSQPQHEILLPLFLHQELRQIGDERIHIVTSDVVLDLEALDHPRDEPIAVRNAFP